MTIETVADAIAAAKVIYKGRDKHLAPKWDWWCERLGSARPLASITADDIDVGIQALIESPANHYTKNNGVGLGKKQRQPGTINRYIAALGSLYKLLKLHRRLQRSFPAPSFKGLRLPEGAGRTLQVSIGDVKRLVDAARLTRNWKLPALIAVASTTGLRKSNLQQLAWGDVDLKARTIDVSRTKNGAPIRSVLPTWAASELLRIKPDNPEKHWLVFGSKDFRKAWESTLELAGIPGSEGWTFHHCRHIAASVLAQSGASLPVIMGCLNHKSPAMALRYSHVNTAALEKAVSSAWA